MFLHVTFGVILFAVCRTHRARCGGTVVGTNTDGLVIDSSTTFIVGFLARILGTEICIENTFIAL